MRTRQAPNELERLLFRQDRGQAFWSFGENGVDGEVERLFEHVAIQEKQSAEGLVLSRHRDLLMHRQVRQKRLNFSASHLVGTSFVVEENVPLEPGDVRFLSTNRIVLESYGIANLVEKFLGTSFHGLHLIGLNDRHADFL